MAICFIPEYKDQEGKIRRNAISNLGTELMMTYGEKLGADIYNSIVLDIKGENSFYNFLQKYPVKERFNDQQQPRFEIVKEYYKYIQKKQKDEKLLSFFRVNVQNDTEVPFFLLTANDTDSIMQSISHYFLDFLYGKGLNVFDAGKETVRQGALLGIVRAKMDITNKIKELQDKLEKTTKPAERISLENHIKKLETVAYTMLNHSENYYKYFRGTYLKSLDIELVEDNEILKLKDNEISELEKTIEEGADVEGGDFYGVDAFLINPKDNAPKELKRLLVGLPDYNRDGSIKRDPYFGTIKTKPYQKVFGKLSDALSNQVPNVKKFLRIIENLNDPTLNTLVSRLKIDQINTDPSYSFSKDDKKWKSNYLRLKAVTAFIQLFSKHKYEFSSLIELGEQNYRISNASQESNLNVIKSTWLANFEKITNTTYSKEGKVNWLRFGNKLAKADAATFLKMIGIEFSNEDFWKPEKRFLDSAANEISLDSLVQDFKKQIDFKLAETLTDSQRTKYYEAILPNLYRAVSTVEALTRDSDRVAKQKSISAILKKLMVIENNSDDRLKSLTHVTPDGKMYYDINLNSYVTLQADLFNDAAARGALEEEFPHLFGETKSAYNSNSLWGAAIESDERIEIGILEGIDDETWYNQGSRTKDLSGFDLYKLRLEAMLSGRVPLMRAADRGNELFIKIKGGTDFIYSKESLKNIIIQHFEAEAKALVDRHVKGIGADIEYYDKNSYGFRVFGELNKVNKEGELDIDAQIAFIKKYLVKKVENSINPEGEIEFNGEEITIDKFIDDKINRIINIELDYAKKQGLNTNNTNFLTNDFVRKMQEAGYLISNMGRVSIELLALNVFVQNIEQTKLLIGDPALYKSPAELFKRISMLNSTKQVSIVDPIVLDYIKAQEYLFEAKAGYSYADDDLINSGKMRTMVLRDVIESLIPVNVERKEKETDEDYAKRKEKEEDAIFDAIFNEKEIPNDNGQYVLAKQYVSIFKERVANEITGNVSKAKSKVKALMKPYREMNIADAIAYSTLDNYKRLMIFDGSWTDDHEVTYHKLASNSPTTVDEIKKFTERKDQYTGVVQHGGVHIIGGRKFSVFPLIPQILPKGSNLEKLNNEMLANGIGMAFLESAAKFGTHKNKHSLYDENGEFGIDFEKNNTFDILDLKYYGNQLKINDDEKQMITTSTQKRKQIFANFYENGVIAVRDTELQRDLEEFNNLQAKVIDDSFNKLLKALGLDKEDKNSLTPEQLEQLEEARGKQFVDLLKKVTDLEAEYKSIDISLKDLADQLSKDMKDALNKSGIEPHLIKYAKINNKLVPVKEPREKQNKNSKAFVYKNPLSGIYDVVYGKEISFTQEMPTYRFIIQEKTNQIMELNRGATLGWPEKTIKEAIAEAENFLSTLTEKRRKEIDKKPIEIIDQSKVEFVENTAISEEELAQRQAKREELRKLVKEARKEMNAITEVENTSLVSVRGVGKTIPITEENIGDIVSLLKKKFFESSMNMHSINALDAIEDLRLIDVIPEKQKVEHTIMSMFRKEVLSSKRPGQSLAQVSSLGFEIGARSSTLKFYEKRQISLANRLQQKLEQLYPEIKLDISNDPKWAKSGKNIFNQEEYDNRVRYTLKAVDILSSERAEKIFEKGEKAGWDLNKTLTELQVPKEQKQIILDKNLTNREEIITSLLAENSFVVEVNTAKEGSKKEGFQNNRYSSSFTYNGFEYNSQDMMDINNNGTLYEKYNVETNESFTISREEYIKAAEDSGNISKEKINNTSYYSNLTVPGGTNYTENEIATPNIKPSIKGHGAFSTNKGIGWFRSDDRVKGKKEIIENVKDIPVNQFKVGDNLYFRVTSDDVNSNWIVENGYGRPSSLTNTEVINTWNTIYNSENTTTNNSRRVLEVQSDLFQKGRESKVLVSEPRFSKKQELLEAAENQKKYAEIVKKQISEIKFGESSVQQIDMLYRQQQMHEKNARELLLEAENASDIRGKDKNDFLQLLNQKNNWVTFFVKSIIQDSAKKGYEKVLFPKGDTAAKIEGHQTLEEFKKRKEDRIKELEKLKAENKTIKKPENWDEYTEQLEEYGYDPVLNSTENFDKIISSKEEERIDIEINQLRQELADVEAGKTQLSAIAKFYEETITNVLKKNGYNPVEITDEYGNKWSEIDITPEVLSDILFQRNEANKIIGQSNIKAGTVLIDAINQKADTLPHEYAHHYIAWNRDSAIVKEGIKKWGSEEALVQAIGEQAVKQKGAAWSWWNKFVKWLLGDLSKLSKLEKDQLRNILTDAFLNRQDLTKLEEAKEQEVDTAPEYELLPMQIKIPLPMKLVDYVAFHYGNGEFSQEALDDFNDDVRAEEEEFRNTGKMGKLTKIGRMTGFRIPFQGPSSADVAHVVEYLNPTFGTGVVVPKEMVAKTGSDFDIDKLNLYMNYFSVNDNIISFDDKNEFNRLNELEQKITLHAENAGQLLAPLGDSTIKEVLREYRETIGEPVTKRDNIEEIFTNAMNIQKTISFLSGKAGVGQTAVHVSNHPLAQMAGLEMQVGNELGSFRGMSSRKITYMEEFENEEGQIVPKYFHYIKMGGKTDVDGNLITETLSEMLTAYVDVAKDDYIFDLNAVNKVANTMLLMLRAGISPRDVFFFLNQPIIKEYIKQEQIQTSKTYRNVVPYNQEPDLENEDGVPYSFRDKLTIHAFMNLFRPDTSITTEDGIEIINKKNEASKKLKELQKEKDPNDISMYQLVHSTDYLKKSLNKPVEDSQLYYLNKFINLQKASGQLQKLIRVTSPDTKYFKDFSSANYQIGERAELFTSIMLSDRDIGMFRKEGLRKMMEVNKIVEVANNAKLTYVQTMSNLSIAYNDNYFEELYNFKNTLSDFVSNQNQRETMHRDVDYDFVAYLLSTQLNGENKVNYFDIYDKSIGSEPKKSLAFKIKARGGVLAEYIIPQFKSEGLVRRKENRLKVMTKVLDQQIVNLIMEDLLSLREENRELYEEFVNVALVQSPFIVGSFNLLRFLPVEDFVKISRNVLEKANMQIDEDGASLVNIDEFKAQFLLANPKLLYESQRDSNFKFNAVMKQGETKRESIIWRGRIVKPEFNFILSTLFNQESMDDLSHKFTILKTHRNTYLLFDPVTKKLIRPNGIERYFKLFGDIREVSDSPTIVDLLLDEYEETFEEIEKENCKE